MPVTLTLLLHGAGGGGAEGATEARGRDGVRVDEGEAAAALSVRTPFVTARADAAPYGDVGDYRYVASGPAVEHLTT